MVTILLTEETKNASRPRRVGRNASRLIGSEILSSLMQMVSSLIVAATKGTLEKD